MRSIAEGNKTEKATPKRRRDERKKGNIFKSKDITSALGVLTVFGSLWLLRGFFYSHIAGIFQEYLGGFAAVSSLDGYGHIYLASFALQILILGLPLLFVGIISSAAMELGQSRLNVSFQKIKPDFKRLDPIKGLKRIITLRSLVELLKSSIKIFIVGFVVYGEINKNLPEFMRLYDLGIAQSLSWTIKTIVFIALKAGLAMMVLGIMDYLYQWWEYERQIRMSKQEVKDEYKQIEGSPEIKGLIKERQRKMAMHRMMQSIKFADAIIRNPTHFAVAIKYDEKKSKAPIVLAKGQDYLALKIIEEGKKEGITITENPPLARGLYAAVEIGQEIPPEYYQAVAEVLAFVYKLKRRTGPR